MFLNNWVIGPYFMSKYYTRRAVHIRDCRDTAVLHILNNYIPAVVFHMFNPLTGIDQARCAMWSQIALRVGWRRSSVE